MNDKIIILSFLNEIKRQFILKNYTCNLETSILSDERFNLMITTSMPYQKRNLVIRINHDAIVQIGYRYKESAHPAYAVIWTDIGNLAEPDILDHTVNQANGILFLNEIGELPKE